MLNTGDGSELVGEEDLDEDDPCDDASDGHDCDVIEDVDARRTSFLSLG